MMTIKMKPTDIIWIIYAESKTWVIVSQHKTIQFIKVSSFAFTCYNAKNIDSCDTKEDMLVNILFAGIPIL